MEQHYKALEQLRAGVAALGEEIRSQTVRTSRTVHWASKGALADFDRLNRLNFGGGGSSTLTVTTDLARELGKVDLSAVQTAFEKVGQALSSLGREKFSGLEWAWTQLLQPMSQWSQSQSVADFLTNLHSRIQTLTATAQTARPSLSWLWESLLKPMGAWTGQTVQTALEGLKTHIDRLAGGLTGLRPGLTGTTGDLSELVRGFQTASQSASQFQGVGNGLFSALTTLTQSLGGAVETVDGKLSGLYPAFKTAGNAAIGAANTALGGIESAVNAMSTALKALSIDIPSWVPVVGGKKLSLDLGSVALPRVPQLARGAVLPANKPFLAMVGDQKNGTNIEAPLATIEQALSNVLLSSLPGQQAANELLAQILSAIEGISVGDDTIGRAARRYEQRMAVLGGSL